MTGSVSWEALYWVVGVISSAGAAVALFLIWVYRLVAAFNAKLAERDAAAQLEVARAKLVEEGLRQAINDFKVEAAEKFATKDGVSAAVSRVETSIDKLTDLVHDSIERLTDRLDRVLEMRSTPASRRTTSG